MHPNALQASLSRMVTGQKIHFFEKSVKKMNRHLGNSLDW